MKLVLEEVGTDLARRSVAAATAPATSQISRVELASALARAHNEGRLDERSLSRARSGVAGLWAGLMILSLDDAVVDLAVNLVDRHGLRAYDAVQLASALALGAPTMTFACWDRDLRVAAKAEGLELLPDTLPAA